MNNQYKVITAVATLILVVLGISSYLLYGHHIKVENSSDTDMGLGATTSITDRFANLNPETLIRDQLFDLVLPKKPIKTVYFYAFGTIATSTIDIMMDAIHKEIGAETFFIGSDQRNLPQQEGIYDSKREQYDGDVVWKIATAHWQTMKEPMDDIRVIYVFDDDLFTKLGNDARPYIMSRASPDQAVTVLSLFRLKNLSDTSNDPASLIQFNNRVRKLVLRNLGSSTGLQLSASTNDPTCIMSSANNLTELDQKAGSYCADEATYISKAFVNMRAAP